MKILASALSCALLAGCGAATTSAPSSTAIVVTTTPLGSVTKEIAECAGAKVSVLMPPGVDPHDFELSSAQGVELAKAKLVITNGLGLEQKLKSSLEGAQKDGATVLEVGKEIDPIPFVELEVAGKSEEKSGEHKEEFTSDPHFWLDPAYMAKAATKIGAKAAEVTKNDKFTSCAATTSEKLAALGKEFATKFQALPADKRVLVTDHEAFGYFAKAYGFSIVGVAVPGGSTDAKPSAAHIAAVAKAVKDKGASVIFSNVSTNPNIVEQIAKEAGTNVRVVPLLVESVGDGKEATYEGMMRHNVDTILDALRK